MILYTEKHQQAVSLRAALATLMPAVRATIGYSVTFVSFQTAPCAV